MGTWSITPDIGIGADGSVTFPENTDLTEKTYTITYTDGNMVCSKTVKQKGRDCVCSINVNGETIGKNAGTYTFARYTADTCVEITVTKNADWITAIGVDTTNQTITGTVTANDAVTGRTATINVNGKAGDETCSKSFDLAQEGKGCDCDNLSVDKTSLTWDYGDSSPKDIIVTSSSCVTNISIPSSTEHYTITTTHTDTQDKIIVQPRDASVVSEDTFSITYLRDCDITISLKQGAQYDCRDISTIDGSLTEYRFPLSQINLPGMMDLVWVVAPSDITTYDEFMQHIDGLRAENAYVKWDDWGHQGESIKRSIVLKTLSAVTEPEVSHVYITVDGQECEVGKILRTCPCAMDNCYPDEIDEGSKNYDYPLPVVSYLSSTGYTIDNIEYPIYPYVNDAVCISDVTRLYYVDEYNVQHQIWGEGGFFQDGIGFIPNVVGQEYTGFSAETSEGVKLYYDGNEGRSQMVYECPINTDFVRKDYTINFMVEPNTPIICDGNPGWQGQNSCTAFTVHLHQAPCGGQYIHRYKDEEGSHSLCTDRDPYTKEVKRRLIRIRENDNPYAADNKLIACPILPEDRQPIWCDYNTTCEKQPWQISVDNIGDCKPTIEDT